MKDLNAGKEKLAKRLGAESVVRDVDRFSVRWTILEEEDL
jgi:hypothetical protein